MTRDEINAGESETLEFKEQLPNDHKTYIKTLVAFANQEGYAGPGFPDTRLTHVLLALSQGSAYHLTKPRATHHEQPYT